MEPNQDDAIARRREQNRMAQRRFRWKRSQQKVTIQEQETQHKTTERIPDESDQQEQDESATASGPQPNPYHRLVTPPLPTDDTDTILSPDFLALSFDTPIEPDHGTASTSVGTDARSSVAVATAKGMGGLLLGDHAVLDFADLGTFSGTPSTPDTYHVGWPVACVGEGSSSGSRVVHSLRSNQEAAISQGDAIFGDATSASDGHRCNQNVPGYPPLRGPIIGTSENTSSNPEQEFQPVPSCSNTPRSTPNVSESTDVTARGFSPLLQPLPLLRFSGLSTSSSRRVAGSGPDPDRGWMSPLHLAASRGHDRIVRMLLQRQQAGVDEPDSEGLTALMYAVQGGFEDVVRSLLEAGAAVGEPDGRGRTALHWAVIRRHEALLRQLLQYGAATGANIDAYDSDGRTPLHSAIDASFEAGVQLLLEFGADLTCKAQKST